MNIVPIGDKILVRPDRIEEKVGSIFIPESSQDRQDHIGKSYMGTVLAVGTGKEYNGKLVPLEVLPGDRVVYGKYSGDEHKQDGEDLLILTEKEVLAIVREE